MTLIYGIGPVLEALRVGRRKVHRVHLVPGRDADSRHEPIRMLARAGGVPVSDASSGDLERRTQGGLHQGVMAEAEPLPVVPFDAAAIAARGSATLVVVLDGVQDPQNLGAILRTAECAGATALVVPRDRSAPLTPAAVKVAEGAAEHVPILSVVNLVRAIAALKDAGLWAVALDGAATKPWCEVDLRGPTVVVLGSEGRGVRRLVQETCDESVSLPLLGRLESLNVSAAAAAVLYETVRQRRGRGSPAGGS